MTQEEINILMQPTQQKFIKLEVYDINNNKLNTIEGNLLGGTLSIDSTVAIRRSLSGLNFVVTDKKFIPGYNSYFWINTKIRIAVGIKSIFTGKIIWFHMGWFLIDKPDIKRSQTTYEVTITGSDKMMLLNGGRGGYLSDAVRTEIAIGTPISQAIRDVLTDFGETNYLVDDILDTDGVVLTVPTTIDKDNTSNAYELINTLGTLYDGWQIYYSAGTSTEQPVFVYQAIKDMSDSVISWDFSENNTIIDIDNQPNFDGVANSVSVYGSSNTQYSPSGLALSATSGNLVAGSYAYCVTAMNSNGQSTPCLEVGITLSSTGGVILAWSEVTDAESTFTVSYCIYGRKSGEELLLGTTTSVTFTDNGSAVGTTEMPTGQAYAKVENNTATSPFSIANAKRVINYSETESTFTTNEACLARAEKVLWQKSYLAEGVTISSSPLYGIDVNQIIKLDRKDLNLTGKFLITKLSFDLTLTGIMTLTCSRLYKYESDATSY